MAVRDPFPSLRYHLGRSDEPRLKDLVADVRRVSGRQEPFVGCLLRSRTTEETLRGQFGGGLPGTGAEASPGGPVATCTPVTPALLQTERGSSPPSGRRGPDVEEPCEQPNLAASTETPTADPLPPTPPPPSEHRALGARLKSLARIHDSVWGGDPTQTSARRLVLGDTNY